MSPRRAENPPLDRDLLADDPIEQFAIWFQQAEAIVPLAEAMTLATVDEEGSPDARMVLLKGFGPDGFRFFSNYESTKGVELAAIPRAALIIYWRELDRQVRVRGAVERLPAAESDAYFASRPRDSRIAASSSWSRARTSPAGPRSARTSSRARSSSRASRSRRTTWRWAPS